MKLNKYSENDLKNAVKNSRSIRGALILLNVAPYGGNYDVFKKAVKHFNVDTNHFEGQGWNKGNTPTPPKPVYEYLNNHIPITSYKLKNRLLRENIKKHECECCKKTHWLNKKIPLELHHINGNNKDNKLTNLLLLCPNCHTLTDGYRNRK